MEGQEKVIAEVVSLGKDKILNLLLDNRGYLMDWDYNSQLNNLAERFISWCKSSGMRQARD